MAEVLKAQHVTKAEKAIHNPVEPRHFMRIKEVSGSVRVLFNGEPLAASDAAIRVLEVGSDFYDPIFYFPREDVSAHFAITDKDTHCPLKGDAMYFDLLNEDREKIADEIAWCYPEPFDFASEIKDLIAFDGSKVTIEEHPVSLDQLAVQTASS
jgi:uncharacterized protein (DUF427 family)